MRQNNRKPWREREPNHLYLYLPKKKKCPCSQGFIQHNGHFLAAEKIYNTHAKLSVCVTVCDALIWRMRRISVYEIVQLWATLRNALYEKLLVVQRRKSKEVGFSSQLALKLNPAVSQQLSQSVKWHSFVALQWGGGKRGGTSSVRPRKKMLHCVQGRDIDCWVAMNPSVSPHLHIVVSVDTFSVMGAFACLVGG